MPTRDVQQLFEFPPPAVDAPTSTVFDSLLCVVCNKRFMECECRDAD
jgi:hypothetical protein